jgi:hypothetical protein
VVNHRQNLITALEGGYPPVIPYRTYTDFVTDDPAWEALFQQGLVPIQWSSTTRRIPPPEVEQIVQRETWGGLAAECTVLCTPIGEISRLVANNWVQEFWLKTPADYLVMEYIVRHTQIEPAVEIFTADEAKWGRFGLCLDFADRSPWQVILVDYTGLQGFSYHLADGFTELRALVEVLEDQLLETCRLIANGPAKYVSLLENLSAETWGTRRFAKYHLSVYAKILPILHASGKKVYAHCDGQLACLTDLLNQTEMDGIDSLTQPLEGDMSYAQARTAFPGKFFLANFNVSLYDLPPAELQRSVRQMVRDAAADGRLLAFEISKYLPTNWRESVPVVLVTLSSYIS